MLFINYKHYDSFPQHLHYNNFAYLFNIFKLLSLSFMWNFQQLQSLI